MPVFKYIHCLCEHKYVYVVYLPVGTICFVFLHAYVYMHVYTRLHTYVHAPMQPGNSNPQITTNDQETNFLAISYPFSRADHIPCQNSSEIS